PDQEPAQAAGGEEGPGRGGERQGGGGGDGEGRPGQTPEGKRGGGPPGAGGGRGGEDQRGERPRGGARPRPHPGATPPPGGGGEGVRRRAEGAHRLVEEEPGEEDEEIDARHLRGARARRRLARNRPRQVEGRRLDLGAEAARQVGRLVAGDQGPGGEHDDGR